VALIVPTLVYGAILTGLVSLTQFLPAAFGDESSTAYTDRDGQTFSILGTHGLAGLTVTIIGSILTLLVWVVMQAGLLTGCLDIADGQPVTIASFFRPRNLSSALPAGLLVGVAAGIGQALCIIPGLIVSFFTLFTIAFAVDRSTSPIDSVKASIATVRAHTGPTLLSWLVQIAAIFIGVILCLVGALIGYPIAVLVLTYTYRMLSGGRVVPLEQPSSYPG
jgi:hypothetical protein